MMGKTEETGVRTAISALTQLGLAEAAGWTPAERAALLRLGRDGLARGDWMTACGLLEYAALLDPDRAETWELVAGARMAARRWAEALAAVEVAWALGRTWRRATLAALCCARLGDAAAAERWRKAARDRAPDDEEEYRRMERALEDQEVPS
ncbi:MAG: hypothetical protein GYA57_06255 [Myxococcales bacterium]|nr:hypothetical protein [Myxococcales bacterium]